MLRSLLDRPRRDRRALARRRATPSRRRARSRAPWLKRSATARCFAATRDTLMAAFGGPRLGWRPRLRARRRAGPVATGGAADAGVARGVPADPSIAVMPVALVRSASATGWKSRSWPSRASGRCSSSPGPRSPASSRACSKSPRAPPPPLATSRKIVVPAVLPRMFVALRLAAGIALIVAVTVEIAVNPHGLGERADAARQALRPELTFALLVWVGVVGFALNEVLLFAEARPVPGRRAVR